MTGSLDRDALLQRLRDDPPVHLRTLARLSEEGAGGLPEHPFEALTRTLEDQPPRFELDALQAPLRGGQRGRVNPDEYDEHINALVAMMWWLAIDGERPSEGPTVWQDTTLDGSIEVRGDLIVKGDLDIVPGPDGRTLIVWGDLNVSGDLTINRSNSSSYTASPSNIFVAGASSVGGSIIINYGGGVLVTGNALRVERSIQVFQRMFVGDRIDAPLVTLGCCGLGGDWLMGDVNAIVFDEEHSPGWCVRLPQASIIKNDEMALGVAPAHRTYDGGHWARIYEYCHTPEAQDAMLRGTLHQNAIASCGFADERPLSLRAAWVWDVLWPALFQSNTPLDQLFRPHAIQSFQNRLQAR